MTRLEQMEEKWINLSDAWNSDADHLAAPFLSIPAIARPSILYIGKATGKDWYRKEFRSHSLECMEARLIERHECTKNFLNLVCTDKGEYDSAFWRHARSLSTQAAMIWNQKVERLQNLAWTNICKVGAVKGNPSGKLREAQRTIAADTLRLEAELYRPSLIYFVTWNFEEDVVDQFIGENSEQSWRKERENEYIWWRPAMNGQPPMLWTQHPERKNKNLTERWLRFACELCLSKVN